MSDAVRGFTLVELLIALLLFAMLAAAATGLLAFGVDARAQSGARLATLAALTRSRALLGADLGQAAMRPWRDEAGRIQPALATGDGAIGLVRRGWRNDGGAPRASLQRVEYRLTGDRFERRSAPMVDGAALGPPAPLIGGVKGLSWRFFSQGEWRDRWDPEDPAALPEAIEVTIVATATPALRQAFLVAPGPAS